MVVMKLSGLFAGVLVSMGTTLAGAQASAGIDCAKATGSTEKIVCQDKGLAVLDAKMTALYQASGRSAATVAQQRRDLMRSSGCSTTSDARGCIEAAYRRRIIALEIEQGTVTGPKKAKFDCGPGKKVFSASFYNGTDPASVMLVYGNDHAVALIAMSGSGARYTAPGIEYWEHQGEAAVTWRGNKMVCKVSK